MSSRSSAAISAAAMLLVATCSNAAPTVSGVSGTVSNGNTITISGSSFGSGPTVNVFDNFEAGSSGSAINTSQQTFGAFTSVWDDGAGHVPRTSTSYAHAGIKSMVVDFTAGTRITLNALGLAFSPSPAWMISWWVMMPSGSRVPDDGAGPNLKQWWTTAGAAGSEIADYVDVLLSSDGTSSLFEHANDPSNGGATDCNWHNTLFRNNGVWVRKTWFLRHSTSGGGTLWAQELNGSSQIVPCNNTSATTTYGSNLTAHIQIPGYGRPDSSSVIYLDDVYISTGANAWARVEICNSSTYSSATNCSLLTPTSWGASSISAVVRPGSLTGAAYIFVIDSTNAPSNPYSVTIGGGVSNPTVSSVTCTSGSTQTPGSKSCSYVASGGTVTSQAWSGEGADCAWSDPAASSPTLTCQNGGSRSVCVTVQPGGDQGCSSNTVWRLRQPTGLTVQ